MTNEEMLAALMALPCPELLEASKITDPLGADTFYCGRTVVGLLKKARAEERERCAKLCDAVAAEVSPREKYTSDVPWEAESIGVFDGATDCAKRIRGA